MKIMDSINFEVLRKRWPELATLGGFAEKYAHNDPSSALIKLRTFYEHLVEGIYQTHNLSLPYQRNLFDLLAEDSFKESVPKVVLDKLHQIRLDGNRAAHGQPTDSKSALFCLREAWDLGRWYFITYGGGQAAECPAYQEPLTEDTKAKLKKDKKAALEKLAAQEAQLQELLQLWQICFICLIPTGASPLPPGLVQGLAPSSRHPLEVPSSAWRSSTGVISSMKPFCRLLSPQLWVTAYLLPGADGRRYSAAA